MLLKEPKKYKNVIRWHDSIHHASHTQPICKLYFTKNTFLTFFFKNIWSYQKKALPLHQI